MAVNEIKIESEGIQRIYSLKWSYKVGMPICVQLPYNWYVSDIVGVCSQRTFFNAFMLFTFFVDMVE